MKVRNILLLLLVMALFTAMPAYAQQQTPPSRVNVKFNAKYPEQAGKAQWQETKEGYTATFNDKGRASTSRFTPTGQWLGTQTKLQQKDWPPATLRYMNENHKGFRYLQGMRYDDDKSSRYELNVESNGSRYRIDFDQNGNFVNETPLQQE